MERKRASSQRGSTVVEARSEASKKPLKLVLSAARPSKRRKTSALLEECAQCETADEVLDLLLQIGPAHTDPALAAEEEEKSLALLHDLWRGHLPSTPVCCVVARLLTQQLLQSGQLGSAQQDLLLSLAKHESTGVVVTVLKCYQDVVRKFSTQESLCEEVLKQAMTAIHNTHHTVRVECLTLIGQLGHMTCPDVDSPLVKLEEYVSDDDPRVRSAAFHALTSLHKQGIELPLSVYSKASLALMDEEEDVRMVAVQLVKTLGLEHPDSMTALKQDSSVEVRLVDDAFVKICDLLNDSGMRVRALAAAMLGEFPLVSSHFMEQTLNKKLMSHLKVVKSDHERQRELHAGATTMDWDSGQTWGTGVPKLELDPREISLMSAGACGAFVHGLEDEFMEVRSAAVDSVCQLSLGSKSFAALSLDFLVDMFNDEIESIRLKAINALRRVSAHIELREDQLETVLGVLQESSGEIREALHALLSSARVPSTAALSSTVHALLHNLKKYPGDRQSVWSCLRELGGSHSPLVSSLVPQLLSTHPFFMSKEPDVEDPAYVCILILVFNAAAVCPTISPQFPRHIFRHYAYLRDSLPLLIPPIRTGMTSVRAISTRQKGAGGTSFLRHVLSRASSVGSLGSGRGAGRVWALCIADLQRLARLDVGVAGSALCTAALLQCQLHVSKVSETLAQDLLVSSLQPQHQTLGHTATQVQELFLLSYRLEHTFPGLPPKLQLQARRLRLAGHALLLLLAVQANLDTEQSQQFLKLKCALADRLNGVKSFCADHALPLPPAVVPLLDMDMQTIAMETLTEELQPLITAQYCVDVCVEDLAAVRQLSAVVTEPRDVGKEEVTRFVASLALSVGVEAAIRHRLSSDRIAVQAKFPDGRRLLFHPKPGEVRSSALHEDTLNMAAVISHGVWTEPCPVELCVVTCHPTDLREDVCSSLLSSLLHSASSLPHHGKPPLATPTAPPTCHTHAVHSCPQDNLDSEGGSGVLAISEVATVTVHPLENTSKTYSVFH